MSAGQGWDFTKFKKYFYKKTGLDLDSYKDRQMERRIRQRMERHNLKSFEKFYDLLSRDQEALHTFMDYLTINTSNFFRDRAVFENIKNHILPELLAANRHLKLWSMGCSSGEEPYTLALILARLGALDRASILASDIDERALGKAQKGVYHYRQVSDIPEDLLHRYFSRVGEYYTVSSRIKRIITFRQENFLQPIYHNKPEMHLVLCRNVFIYLKNEVQNRIVESISRILCPEGYLVIGSTEFIYEGSRYGLVKRFPSIFQKTARVDHL